MTEKKSDAPYSFTEQEIQIYSANYSDKVSNINRSLALTGIAIAWLFLYQSTSNQYHLKWLVPIGLFIAAIAIDLIHYVYAFILFYTTLTEKEPDNEKFYTIPEDKIKKNYTYFWFKIILTGFGYICLILLFFFGLPSKDVRLKGTVYEDKAETPVPATLNIYTLPEKKLVNTILTDTNKNGSFDISLPQKGQFLVSVDADSFFYFSYVIDADSISRTGQKYLYKTINLKPIDYGVAQNLDEVYFEFNKANLLPASYESLNKLVRLLKENPNLRIQIDAHTDNIGSVESNRRLSYSRAEAVKRHFTNSGIKSERISTEGFGEEKSIADNNTEYGRAMNRRVEFTLMKIN